MLTVDRVGNYCRVFTHMAECCLDAMITTPNQVRVNGRPPTSLDYTYFPIPDPIPSTACRLQPIEMSHQGYSSMADNIPILDTP